MVTRCFATYNYFSKPNFDKTNLLFSGVSFGQTCISSKENVKGKGMFNLFINFSQFVICWSWECKQIRKSKLWWFVGRNVYLESLVKFLHNYLQDVVFCNNTLYNMLDVQSLPKWYDTTNVVIKYLPCYMTTPSYLLCANMNIKFKCIWNLIYIYRYFKSLLGIF